MTQEDKQKIYELMEKFRDHPSNGNRYYEAVLLIVDNLLDERRKEFLADLKGLPKGEDYDGILKKNTREIQELIAKYSSREESCKHCHGTGKVYSDGNWFPCYTENYCGIEDSEQPKNTEELENIFPGDVLYNNDTFHTTKTIKAINQIINSHNSLLKRVVSLEKETK